MNFATDKSIYRSGMNGSLSDEFESRAELLSEVWNATVSKSNLRKLRLHGSEAQTSKDVFLGQRSDDHFVADNGRSSNIRYFKCGDAMNEAFML
ncbi:MAG: hypothetical protein JXQ85_12975 [Cognatishimia sp.]|uniref:hypothetical protein n=1 Tax=Cognatishimia sp. TaxID=2211648 RepID=UPI003B8AF86C